MKQDRKTKTKAGRARSTAIKGGQRGDVFRRQLTLLIDREGSQAKLVARCEARGARESLRISLQSVNDWKNGVSLPRFEQLVWLAECTGVSLDWLCRGCGPEVGSSSPHGMTLADDLGAHLLRAASAEIEVPAAEAGELLAVDGEAMLAEFTGLALRRFQQACRRFQESAEQASAMYRAVRYLEHLLVATSPGIPGVSRDQGVELETAVTELTEELLRHMPEVEPDAPTDGIWFRDHLHAMRTLFLDLEAEDACFGGAVEGPLSKLGEHLTSVQTGPGVLPRRTRSRPKGR